MAIRSIVKANPLLFSNRRKISDGKFCSIRSCAVLCASSKFANLKVKSFVNSTSSFSSTRKEITLEARHVSTSSIKNRVEKDGLDAILKFMRIPIVLVMLSLLGIMMHGRHQSAWAFSGGVMGGSSFSSSSSHSSSDRGSSFDWGSLSDCGSSSSYRSDVRSYPSSSSYRSDVRSYPVGYEKDVGLAGVLSIIALFLLIKWICSDNISRIRTKIIKLQVGLLVDGKSLQKLQIHPPKMVGDICYRSVVEYNNKDAEKYFKKLSTKERMKFSEETLVNLDDMEKEWITTSKQANDEFKNSYMVVTIVIAANKISYESHIPAIVRREDVKNALNKLWHISNTGKIQGLHVLWTPQKEKEVLSLAEFRENYPSLKAFQ